MELEFVNLTTADGVRLRAAITPPAPRSLLLFTGRTEFIEKYWDGLVDLHALGFGCAIVDWRGQGGSARLLDDAKRGHVDDFRSFQVDVDAYLAFAAERLPKPWFGFAHSMGSTILLERLMADPKTVDAAVLSAPFVDLPVTGFARGLGRLLIELTTRFAGPHRYAPGHGPDVSGGKTFETNVLTSDRARFEAYRRLTTERSDLMIGGVTVGWVRAAFAAIDRLAEPGALERIDTPIVVAEAGAEQIVSNEAEEVLARRLPHGRLEEFPGAEHELLLERPHQRHRLLELIDRELRPRRA